MNDDPHPGAYWVRLGPPYDEDGPEWQIAEFIALTMDDQPHWYLPGMELNADDCVLETRGPLVSP